MSVSASGIGDFLPLNPSVEGFSVSDVKIENGKYGCKVMTGLLNYTYRGHAYRYTPFKISVTEEKFILDFDFAVAKPYEIEVPENYVPTELKEIDPLYRMVTHESYMCYSFIKPMIKRVLLNAFSSSVLSVDLRSHILCNTVEEEIEKAEGYLKTYREELEQAKKDNDTQVIKYKTSQIKQWSSILMELREKEIKLYFVHFIYLLHTVGEMQEAYNMCRKLYPQGTCIMVVILARHHIYGCTDAGYSFENVRAFTTNATSLDTAINNLPQLIELAQSRYGGIAGYFVYDSDYDFCFNREQLVELFKV